MLTGYIPSSLGNLIALESLDLSQNNLAGEIPQQLKQLGFLERFNVSHNNLTGPIPQGNQFNAFESSSFEGNPRLCRDPLFKKCGDFDSSSLPPSVFEENDDSESSFKLDWKFVLTGYISGLVVGVVLSDFVIIKRHGWWLERSLYNSSNLGFLEASMYLITILRGLYLKGSNFIHLKAVHFREIQDCVVIHLLKKCGDLESSTLPSPVSEENDGAESLFKLDWKFVLIGYSSGLVVGVALGDIVIIRRHGWLVKMQRKGRRWRRY
nr:putative receptor like protein 25 [Ziziphus jujuba var. spinosa]